MPVPVTIHDSYVRIYLPSDQWTDDDIVAAYRSFIQGHGSNPDQRTVRTLIDDWRSNAQGRGVDHRPWMGGKFFCKAYRDYTEIHGYCDPKERGHNAEKHRERFFKIAQMYFAQREIKTA